MANEGWTTTEDMGDWDAVSTEPPKPVADDYYVATIVKAEPKPSSTGKPMAKLEVSLSAIYGGDALPSARRLNDSVTIEKSTAFKVKGISRAVGVTPPRTNGFDDVRAWCDALVGQSCVVLTRQESYTPKPKPGSDPNARIEQRTVAKPSRYYTEAEATIVKAGGSLEEAASDGASAAAAGGRRSRRG